MERLTMISPSDNPNPPKSRREFLKIKPPTVNWPKPDRLVDAFHLIWHVITDKQINAEELTTLLATIANRFGKNIGHEQDLAKLLKEKLDKITPAIIVPPKP